MEDETGPGGRMRRRLIVVATGLIAMVSAMPAAAPVPPPPDLRIAWDGPYFGLDPTQEYSYTGWEVLSSLLVRTLVTYRHVEGVEGTELVPDITSTVPEPTDGGLTYSFDLKPGVTFGPPLYRPVTSRDIKYAFKRMVCRRCPGGSYAFYYRDLIVGMDDGGAIEGIVTPDDDTIVFHLTEPAGDFLHRLALPATGPIPREVGRCFPGRRYGRHLIATGPYMIEGSEYLNTADGCEAMAPIGGLDKRGNMTLVHNPSYDPATDSPETREPNAYSRVRFLTMGEREAFESIEAGSLDTAMLEPSRHRVARYEQDASDHPAVHSNTEDVVWYVTMNLTQKPFDDVHVRRAVNWALDRRGVLEAWGGDTWATPATRILTPTLTGGQPDAAGYDPYGAITGPDLERARAEMALSRYDSDDDGLCDARACTTVTLVNRNSEPWQTAEQHVVAALEAIGIEPGVAGRDPGNAYDLIMRLSNGIEMGMNPGWAKDYADASTVIDHLFHSRTLRECISVNYSRVGGTEEIKERCDAPGDYSDVPSVDLDIEACLSISEEAARDRCWHDLDRKLMEEVVPWVPLVWRNAVHVTGPGVGEYVFDQFTGHISLAHISP